MIRYLSQTEIEKDKWDDCIAHSVFETIYPYSWYLDVVSPGWYALVRDDYDMVMPLTWKRKYGIRMLIQPLLAQQLGMFARNEADPDSILEFIRSISLKYLIVDICLNRTNRFEASTVRQEPRYNYELDISSTGNDPGTAYATNTRRNILRGNETESRIEKISMDRYLDLKFSLPENARLKRNLKFFRRLYAGLADKNRAVAYGLYSENELHTAAVLGFSGTRAIYMNGCSSHLGKQNRGMFVLMDHMIRLSQGKYRFFDFEGSNIPGVARFFEGFGAERTVYPRVMRNPFQLFGITS